MNIQSCRFSIPLLKTPICIISFSMASNPHANCLKKYCVKNGGEVCLTQRMQAYLKANTSIYEDEDFREDFPNLKKDSDWGYLEQALARNNYFSMAVINQIKLNKSHRLRLKKHSELGKSLVYKLIDSLHSLRRHFGTIWGTECSFQEISRYRFLFESICKRSENQSVGEIYRLYDLTRGGAYNQTSFPAYFPLCLLFAFRQGSTPMQSVSELVAKFQFFETFVKEGFTSKIRTSIDPSYISEDIGEIVYNLWEGHLIAASQMRYGEMIENTRLLKAIEEHMLEGNQVLPKALQIQLKSNVTIPLKGVRLHTPFTHRHSLKSKMGEQLKKAQRAIGFQSDFDTAYHPFKHKEAVRLFFERSSPKIIPIQDYKFWSQKEFIDYAHISMKEYMSVIKGVIEESKDISAHPSQFDHGTTFTFTWNRVLQGKKHSIRVHAIGFQNGISYILTGF